MGLATEVAPDIAYDPETRHYYRGLQRLYGVGTIIRQTWPLKPSWDGVNMETVENARLRGQVVDELFSLWLAGELPEIPPGTRQDAVIGFHAVREWWEAGMREAAEPQKVVADDEAVGVIDVYTPEDGVLWDLKCTSKIESTYEMQIGGYVELLRHTGHHVRACGVIQCQFVKGGTEAVVRPVIFDPMKALSEWTTLRQMWRLVRRKSGKELEKATEVYA